MSEHEPPGGWITSSAPRIATPPPGARGPLFRSIALASRAFGRSDIPDVFAVLHLHPPLFWGWLHFASRLMPFGRLRAAEREKVILRTAWICRCRYEWGQHVDVGLRAGLDDAAIVRVRRGPTAACDAREATLLRACDELAHERTLAPATYDALRALLSEKELIEFTMLVGQYAMLAAFLNAAGVALEPGMDRALAEFERRTSS